MIDNEALGKVIAQCRTTCALTQADVAEMTGLTVNYLSLLENGHRGASLEVMNLLGDAFLIPAEFMLFLGSVPGEGAGENKVRQEIIDKLNKFLLFT